MADKKTIVVTGGAGFIGSHLCERLVADPQNKVISLDNYFTGSRENHVPGVEYREGHTKDIEEHIPETPDLIFHLGEYSRVEKSFEDVEQVWDLNQYGTFAVLEFARRRGAKLVYAGSSTKFGDGGLGRDQSPYAWSKSSMTELVSNYGEWFGLNYAITYFYNVYGPRERAGDMGTVIAIFKDQYKNGLSLGVVSPGTQERIFTHVHDIVDSLILVGEKGKGDGYGIGGEDKLSILELAKQFGTDVVMLPERQGNRMQAAIDSSKTRALGWSPRRSLRDDVTAYVRETTREPAPEKRIMVFTTTFDPVSGPAEDALVELIQKMPNIHFDIVTAAYTKEALHVPSKLKNATVYRVGYGNRFDKYLLPVLGIHEALALAREHNYLFCWSIVASYGTLPALVLRRGKLIPLLVTLADQSLSWYERLFIRLILSQTDQVYTSIPEQGRKIISLEKRMRARKSLGMGDTFANQIRFAYSAILRNRNRTEAPRAL
jgi:UDP-glucose 4-epimerase